MEYYLTIKKELSVDTCYNMDETWKQVKLCERSWTQNSTYYTIPFIWNIKEGKSIETEVDNGCQGDGQWGANASGYRVLFWSDEHVLELDSGDDCATCEFTKSTDLFTLNDGFYGIWVISHLSLLRLLINNRNVLLIVLEATSLRSGCQRGGLRACVSILSHGSLPPKGFNIH